ncbi:olfactory receptor 5V1-like [Ascaphus truei]|uniref:olfactory receptor 5V1-like n=1 Tax=Ascaphus truei TaxID=8439 RepID=UPI003F5AD88C
MQDQNKSKVTEFLLVGISDRPELQIPLFIVFLLIYLFTLIGNLLIITVVSLNPVLHTPMYFFLCNLSFLDLLYSAVTQTKLLSMLSTGNRTLSYDGCIMQLYLFMCLSCTEFVLLTAMGYDRYVAICKPLHYPLLMSRRVCVLLATTCWAIGFLDTVGHTVVISQLPFCRSHVINHFFCDPLVLMSLSCVDTFFIQVINYVNGLVVGFPSLTLTLTSYVCIISTILKIRSSESRNKAFSTCVSHLTVVILFYGTVMFMYMRPSSQYETSQEKLTSVVYTVLIPIFNPLIYTLRNKDVRTCLKKIRGSK